MGSVAASLSFPPFAFRTILLTRGINHVACVITLALFAPLEDEDILTRLSGTHDQDGVRLHVAAIGWV